MGGYYDRLVRSVKQCLRKSLGPIRLTFIQLQTVLTEIETALNTHPLVYVGSDLESGYCITPAQFLSSNPNRTLPAIPQDNVDPDYIVQMSSKNTLLATWQKGQNHLNQFWQLWKSHYLLSLRECHQTALKAPRIQSMNPPMVGDIVHIQESGPWGTWRLGQVHNLVPSKDGEIRTIKIRLAMRKILTCSVLHVYPMEISSHDPESDQLKNQQSDNTIHTKSQRLGRRAAQQAHQCIKQQTHAIESDQDSEIDEPAHNGTELLSFSTPSRSYRKIHYSFFILLLFTWFSSGDTLKPLLCQAHEAKLVINLGMTIQCPKYKSNGITTMSHGSVQVFKRNTAKYESTAFSCKKIKTVKKAWTNFAKAGWDHSVKEVEAPVSEQECHNMINTHRCQEGPLLGSESVAYTDNQIDYPYTTRNAWDCCTWYTNEISNCFLTKGKVYATFGEIMESNLGNTANCDYSKGTCTLSNSAMLIWEQAKEAQCEFIFWKNFTGKYWNGRFLSDDQEIALTWSLDVTTDVALCNHKTGITTDQGIVITHSFHGHKSKQAQPESSKPWARAFYQFGCSFLIID